MSFRFKINFAISAVILAFSLVTAHVMLNDIKRSISDEIEAGTRVTAQILERFVADSWREDQRLHYNKALLDFLRRLGRVRANEIRLFDGNDELLYESPPSTYKKGRWAPKWFSKIVGADIGEFRLNLPNRTVLVTPDASRSILDAWDHATNFAWLAAVFYLLLNALIFWLVGRWLLPLKSILGALADMKRGNFSARLPRYKMAEFSSISDTFNEMAEALQSSLAENQRLALAVQQSKDAIVITDLQQKISFCNEATTQLFGYSHAELVGESLRKIVPTELYNEISEASDEIKNGRGVSYIETQRLRKDSSLVDIGLSVAPMVDPLVNKVVGEICIMRDVTEHKLKEAVERDLEENRRFTREVQVHLEEERRNIARELHDELGQCVTAIKTIGTAIANKRDSSKDTKVHALKIVDVASHIYGVVHAIIKKLRPSGLDHLGLRATLLDTIEEWSRQNPDVRCTANIAEDIDGYSENMNITVYRIIQECLTNVIRHACASEANISVSLQSDDCKGSLEIEVRDNGKGLAEWREQETTKFGILGMKERVEALKGVFTLSGFGDEGATVKVKIPLES